MGRVVASDFVGVESAIELPANVAGISFLVQA